MISKKMKDVLNKQIEIEAYGSFYYLAMASWCDQKGLDGCAQFFARQSREEYDHMMRIFDYMLDMDAHAHVPAVEKAPTDFKDIFTIFELAYQQEQEVTRSINALVEMAIKENDHSTHNFLQWYIEEQREEEAMMRNIADKLKLIGQGPQSLYFINKELELINEAALQNNKNEGA